MRWMSDGGRLINASADARSLRALVSLRSSNVKNFDDSAEEHSISPPHRSRGRSAQRGSRSRIRTGRRGHPPNVAQRSNIRCPARDLPEVHRRAPVLEEREREPDVHLPHRNCHLREVARPRHRVASKPHIDGNPGSAESRPLRHLGPPEWTRQAVRASSGRHDDFEPNVGRHPRHSHLTLPKIADQIRATSSCRPSRTATQWSDD
jgi:hypothetical protein